MVNSEENFWHSSPNRTREEGGREQGWDRYRKGMWARSVGKGAQSTESVKEREV